jgi:hypothetical protein
MARDDLGRWVAGTSGNAGGRPKPPDGLRNRLAAMSPHAVERLFELLYSADERVSLEAAKTILDRHLGRPAIQADISLHRTDGDAHIAAMLEVARRRALEPIMLDDTEIEVTTIDPSANSG